MCPLGSSFLTDLDGAPMVRGAPDTDQAVVLWLSGEHDISTEEALEQSFAQAIARSRAGIIADLSRVTFMSASTLNAILRARVTLDSERRHLVLRAPSASARKVVDICGLGDLIQADGDPLGHGLSGSQALASWVAVPASEPSERGGRLTTAPQRNDREVANRCGSDIGEGVSVGSPRNRSPDVNDGA